MQFAAIFFLNLWVVCGWCYFQRDPLHRTSVMCVLSAVVIGLAGGVIVFTLFTLIIFLLMVATGYA